VKEAKNKPKTLENSVDLVEIDGFLLPKRQESTTFPVPEDAIIDFYMDMKSDENIPYRDLNDPDQEWSDWDSEEVSIS